MPQGLIGTAQETELTEKVIGCAFEVSNALGTGFLEKVYENALAHEIQKTGLVVEQQKPMPVYYDGVQVGDYYVNLLINETLVLELKAAKQIDSSHIAQTINYLRSARLNTGLILNFGNPRLEIKRLRHDP